MLYSNSDGVAQVEEATESDVEFEEHLRNFELRLREQHLRCSAAPHAVPNSSTRPGLLPSAESPQPATSTKSTASVSSSSLGGVLQSKTATTQAKGRNSNIAMKY